MRRAAAALMAVALMAGAAACQQDAPGVEPRARMVEPGVVEWVNVPPCLDDSGTIPDGAQGCYWDAARMGNGMGDDFTTWR